MSTPWKSGSGEPDAAALEWLNPEAGWAGAEAELPSGWRAIGQPVEFDLQILLASAGPPVHDPQRVARQLAAAIPGAVICYPGAYERGDWEPVEDWREHAFWVHDDLHQLNKEAAQAADTFHFWSPYAPRLILNIGRHGIGAQRFLDAAMSKVSVNALAVVGDSTMTSAQIDRYMPDRPMMETTVLQRPIDPGNPKDCEALAAAARVTYRYAGDAEYESASLIRRGMGLMFQRRIEGDSPSLTRRETFLSRLNDQSLLLRYSTCFDGDFMRGVRAGIVPLSDQIILEIPDLDPENGTIAWPDEGPPWLRPPEIASVDPFTQPSAEDDKAIQAAARAQVGEFHRALRAGGVTRSCVAGVGATPEDAERLAALVGNYARHNRPDYLSEPRFIVVAPGVFGGVAGMAAGVRLSQEFPQARVDVMVTPERSPSLTAGLDRSGVGQGLRVVAGRPLREFADYTNVAAEADRQAPLWTASVRWKAARPGVALTRKPRQSPREIDSHPA